MVNNLVPFCPEKRAVSSLLPEFCLLKLVYGCNLLKATAKHLISPISKTHLKYIFLLKYNLHNLNLKLISHNSMKIKRKIFSESPEIRGKVTLCDRSIDLSYQGQASQIQPNI